MAFIHPIIQAITIAIGLYAGYLGWQRFRDRRFQWNRHIRLGITFFVMIIAGTAIGFAITYLLEGGIFKTGLHALLPFIIIPLLLIGVILGFILSKGRKGRILPPLHMSINYFTMVLIFLQGYGGVGVLADLLRAR
jgi:uncharacterized membrane protein YozB (DUF420 family)